MTTTVTTPQRSLARVELETPIGTLVLEGTDRELTRVVLPGDRCFTATGPASAHDHNNPSEPPAAVATAAEQLTEYFAGRRTAFDVPLATRGTPFQTDVWRVLGEIPYGETISYAELAIMAGRPRAVRAVGQANGANPIPIILACHRVLASGGGIGGYGGGLDAKRALLALEGVTLC